MFNKFAKRLASSVMAAAMILGAVTGCAPAPDETTKVSGNSPSSETASGQTPSPDAVQILFWHSMSGANQEMLMKIVDGFNSSQSDYFVVAQNQGKYDESTSKFFNMNGGEGSPAMIQIGEQNLQSMIDSGLVAPMTDLIQAYGYDEGQLLPQAIHFYSVDQVMYAMPFNASSPVLYYNADALKKAGLSQAPETFEGIEAAAPKIKEANNGMRAFSKPVYGYALDQMVTNMGGLVVNNENGRTARCTEVAYQDEIQEIFGWLNRLIKEDQFVNYGTVSDNVVTGFNQGDIAMFIYTSASAARVIEGAPFEVGIAPLPVPEGVTPQGVYAGGGAVCVANGLTDKVNKGVMEFLKYGTSAEVQAVWAGDTGYFPVNKEAYDTETMKQIYQEKPQLRVAADQLLNSKETASTAGPLLSQLPQLRNDLQSAEEMVFNGGDPKEAMDQAVSATNKQIEAANKSVGQQ